MFNEVHKCGSKSLYSQEWAFSGTGKPYYKGPVNLRDLYTDADIAAEDCIISSLRKHFGDSLKIIGEEVRNQFQLHTSLLNCLFRQYFISLSLSSKKTFLKA